MVNIGVASLTKTLTQNTQQWQNLLQQSGPGRKSQTLSKKRFDCEHCRRKFVYMTGLARHVQKFHPGKETSATEPPTQVTARSDAHPQTFDVVVKCKICGQIFADVKHFEVHAVRYNWEFMVMYTMGMPNEFEPWLLKTQLMIVVIHSALACEFCDALFSDYASLFYHEAHHLPTSGYACTFCKLNFFSLDVLLEHRAQCDEYSKFRASHLLNVRLMYSCNACMAAFANLPELYEHRYSNHHYFPRRNAVLGKDDVESDGLWLCCEICGCIFNNIYALLAHREKNHSIASPGDDSVAEKTPSTQRPVKRVVSKDESNHHRQFLCEKCGKTYTQSSHLWQHLRFHNGIRPFACTVPGCTRRFTIRPDLSDHIRKCHTGERPYECEVCHKRFLTGSVFYQHRLIHRNERRHACEDCDRRFYRADALKNHRRIHTGEKPYLCVHCGRQFRQRGDREKHVRVKHTKYR
uniref:C2H2-type domain-containing protein n=1 Tax=Anopheles culicifacies TaxID=139723 RepID=A0A182MX68_9DIPT